MTTFYSILHPEYTFQEPTFVTINGTTEARYPGDTIEYCRKIRIPLIQRDYAEGRPSPDNKRKIRNFLKQMLDVVYGTKPTASLDFIYGYVQDEAGKRCNMSKWNDLQDIRFAFEPLDGQQRLTTLFLLHWILGREKDLLDTRDGKSLFIYTTRESSSDFCNTLVNNNAGDIITEWKQAVKDINEKNAFAKEQREKESDKYKAILKFPDIHVPAFSSFIQKKEWFKWNWRTDPTICSMLKVLDLAIRMIEDDTRGGYDVACANRCNLDNIHFSLLDELECNGQLLFVKMNARGKELSEFDLAKSELEEEIEKQSELNLSSLKEKTDWTSKIDGDWLDYCWHKITDKWGNDDWGNKNITPVEDYLLKLTKRMIGAAFFNRRQALLDCTEQQSKDTTKHYIQKFINSIYERSNYCHNIIHRYEDYVDEMRKLNVEEYSIIPYNKLINGIDSLLYKDDQGKWHDIDFFTSKSKFTILQDYITSDTVEYLKRLQFYATLLFTTHIANVSKLAKDNNKVTELIDWSRFVLHMFRNENRTQRIDDQYTFESTINELNTFATLWSQSTLTFNEFVSQKPPQLFTTEPDRYGEEQLKAQLKLGSLGEDWKNHFEYLEQTDTKHMLGQYYAPLEWSKVNGVCDLDLFKDYTKRLHEIFEGSTDKIQIKCMLSILAYNDYLFSNQQKGFSSLRNFIAASRDFSWKRFLRDSNHMMFKEWLDRWKSSSLPLTDYLDTTILDATKTLKSSDWRYYLLRTSVDGLLELFKRNYSAYYNIRMENGHPYIVHAKTSRGDKQYDIIMVYLVDRFKTHPNIKSIDYNKNVRSDYTELSLTTNTRIKLNIKNFHDKIYHIEKGKDDVSTFDASAMILYVERIVNKY